MIWLKYSRWRPTTIMDHSYVNNFVKSHSRKLKFCYIVAYKVIHIGLYFGECSFRNYVNIQDGVQTPYWIRCFADRLIWKVHHQLGICRCLFYKMLFKIFLGESDFITLKQKETRSRFLYIIQTVNLNHCLLSLLSILLEFSEFVNRYIVTDIFITYARTHLCARNVIWQTSTWHPTSAFDARSRILMHIIGLHISHLTRISWLPSVLQPYPWRDGFTG